MAAAELAARLEAVRRLRDDAEHDWDSLAREEQREPPGEWSIFVLLGGRGMGKTRSLTEALRRRVRTGASRESALVGATAADARDVLVEGPAGVLAVCTSRERPTYEPSRRRLAWPNGAVTHVYSADEPERLRGPQHDFAIGDELRAWRYLAEALDNLLLGLRMGPDPRACFATTPAGRRELRALLDRPGTVVSRGTTFDNLSNLSGAFRERVLERYEGTRLGRAELYGEMLEDVEGALWRREWIDDHRVEEAPECQTLVIGLDPADGIETGDEQALCLAGVGLDRQLYVFVSEGVRDTPMVWLTRAVHLGRDMGVKRLVLEKNHGGQFLVGLLEQAMEKAGVRVPYQVVDARSGKRTRAEPIAALFEQGAVHMVGHHPALEEQLLSWTGEAGQRSPDRLDSMTWALTDLMGYARSGATDMGSAVPYTDDPRTQVEGGAVPWEGSEYGSSWEQEREVLYLPR